MPWTPQKSWTSEVLTSSDLNTYMRDDMEYLKGVVDGVGFQAVKLSRGAATSIPNSAFTAITWTDETYDYGGWWSSGTDIVVPAGAVPAGFTSIAVLVFARTRFAANGTGSRAIQPTFNGSASLGAASLTAITGELTEVTFADLGIVEAGDTITLELYQTSGGNLNATSTSITVARYAPAA